MPIPATTARRSTSARFSVCRTAGTRISGTRRDAVSTFVRQLAADLGRVDPAHRSTYEARAHTFETDGMTPYDRWIERIRAHFGGTPIGASESLVTLWAGTLGLKLLTPASFVDAVSEGNEPTASDKATVDAQIATTDQGVHLQHAERDARCGAARRRGPLGAHSGRDRDRDDGARARPFQQWQSRQAHALYDTLRGSERDDGCSLAPGARVDLGGRTVWRDVDLEVAAGEFVAVLGPNGVGQVDAAQGAPRAGAGRRGRDAGARPGAGRGRSDIGYLPQRRSFDPSLRIRGVDVVRLGLDGDRWGVPLPGAAQRGSERARVDELIELVGADGVRDAADRECSGGEQQRLLIAQALARRPRLLLLDEPLDSLDFPTRPASPRSSPAICRRRA